MPRYELGGGFKYFDYILTNMFQLVWKHQLVKWQLQLWNRVKILQKGAITKKKHVCDLQGGCQIQLEIGL